METLRFYKTLRAENRLRRVLCRMARTLAKKDVAYEHYADKITANNTTIMHKVYLDLYAMVGPAALELTCTRIIKSRAYRRILVLLISTSILYMNYLNYASVSYSRFAAISAIVLLYTLSTLVVHRAVAQTLKLFQANQGDLSLFFANKNTYRILKKYKKSLPALSVSAHSGQDLVLKVLREKDQAVVEILSILSLEYNGTAIDLLRTARQLR